MLYHLIYFFKSIPNYFLCILCIPNISISYVFYVFLTISISYVFYVFLTISISYVFYVFLTISISYVFYVFLTISISYVFYVFLTISYVFLSNLLIYLPLMTYLMPKFYSFVNLWF